MIETANLKLIACELKHFEAALRDERELASLLEARIADGWLDFPKAMQFGYQFLKANPEMLGWWSYLFIHKRDNALIGNGGFKGKPDDSGIVEIGYAIAPAYREKGYATEAARGMTDFAFAHQIVNVVQAHTLAEPNASTRVLQKIGMKHVGEFHDAEDGDVWRWLVTREEYANQA